jgi:hypothetical protein
VERTLISWNVPNLITVPLMAFTGFLVAALIWQGVMRLNPPAQAASTSGGY